MRIDQAKVCKVLFQTFIGCTVIFLCITISWYTRQIYKDLHNQTYNQSK